jgi:hypothetical protein
MLPQVYVKLQVFELTEFSGQEHCSSWPEKIPQQNRWLWNMERHETASDGMNESSTCSQVEPKLTQACSWPVLRAGLIKHREIVKADSPKGHVYSNLVEMGDNALTYVRPDWAKDRRQTLPYFMECEAKRAAT